MVLPNQTINILDPSLGLVSPTSTNPVYWGVSSDGPLTELLAFSQPEQVRETLGFGDLPECVMLALQEGGGPVYAIRREGNVSGTVSLVTAVSAEGVTAVANGTTEPAMRAFVVIECVEGGPAGTAKIRFTFDQYTLITEDPPAPTFSQVYTIPGGESFVIPNLNVTIDFDTGGGANDFTEGDIFSFSCTPPVMDAADYSQCGQVLRDATHLRTNLVFSSDVYADAADGVTAFNAMATELDLLEQNFRYMRSYVDVGSEDSTSNVLAVADTYTSTRVGGCYGFIGIQSVSPFEGMTTYLHSTLISAASRCASTLISTDQARFAEGPLPNIRFINFDSSQNEQADDAGLTTLRTFPGISGFYIGNGRLKAPFGSDFQFMQYGRVMDIACQTSYEAMQPFLAEGFRTVSDPPGAIDPLDAADVQEAGIRALSSQLLELPNARGTGGHVSSIVFQVDLTNNLATTGVLIVRIGILPLGYSRFITQTIGFTTNAEGI